MYIIPVVIVVVIGYFVYKYWKYKASDDGAPYVAMEQELVETILQTAQVNQDDVVYDLGSGDGRIPITSALLFHARAVGVEIDKLRYLYSQYKRFILRLGDKVTFLNKNIFEVNLSEATVVVMYLLQETNEALTEKLLTELKPGTIIISGAFNFPDWQPIFVDRDHKTPFGPIYYYQIPGTEQIIQTPQTTSPTQQTPVQPAPTPTK